MPPKQANKPQSTQRLKIVVRRLPPDLPEAIFWKSVSPWVTRETAAEGEGQDTAEVVLWTHYRPGKIRKSNKDKDDLHSRAYISFKTPDALVAFHRGYDGWNFRDRAGNVSQAVVEFAPYQRIPAPPPKQDPRQGTIDQDADFLAFQEALTAPPVAETPAEAVDKAGPKSTPLLDHLRAQKAAEIAARPRQATASGSKGKGKKGAKEAKGQQGGGASGRGKKGSKSANTSEPGSGASTPTGAGPSNGKGKGKGKGKQNASASASGGQAGAGGAGGGKRAPPPHLPFAPPGFPGASTGGPTPQQSVAQADLVRQRLQQQHQARQAQAQAAQQQAAQPPAPAPRQLLRNPARQPPPPSQTPPSGSSTPVAQSQPQSQQQQGQPSQGQPPALAKEAAGQRRQLGAALGAALSEASHENLSS
ncbi:Smg-4/UPF3 family-domain-containing protein [Leucosporidium creatinivorum]|uniref:Smg-4/UPF3 family-domain-containing protein n=1 Tax=Leucosporidium creatinivorum TaxID=106004 RepID=A0A1Y2DJQ9_9BASI|nr:Smg-4/UPF3 family-domain-containing protein [Leucosporidium creatinivorum]